MIEQKIVKFIREQFPDEDPAAVFTALVKVASRLCIESITSLEDRPRMDLEGFTPLDKSRMLRAIKPFQRAVAEAFGDV